MTDEQLENEQLKILREELLINLFEKKKDEIASKLSSDPDSLLSLKTQIGELDSAIQELKTLKSKLDTLKQELEELGDKTFLEINENDLKKSELELKKEEIALKSTLKHQKEIEENLRTGPAKIKDLQSKIDSNNEAIKKDEQALESIANKIESLQKQIGELKAKKTENESKLEKVRTTIKLAEDSKAKNYTSIADFKKQKKSLKASEPYLAAQSAIDETTKELEQIDNEILALENKKVEREQKLAKRQAELNAVEQKIAEYQSELRLLENKEEEQPTEITKKKLKDLKKQIENLKTGIDGQIEIKEAKRKKIDKTEKEIKDILSSLETFQLKKENIKKELAEHKNTWQSQEDQRQFYKNKIADLKEEIKKIEGEIKDHTLNKRNLRDTILKQIDDDIDVLNENLSKEQKQKQEITARKDKLAGEIITLQSEKEKTQADLSSSNQEWEKDGAIFQSSTVERQSKVEELKRKVARLSNEINEYKTKEKEISNLEFETIPEKKNAIAKLGNQVEQSMREGLEEDIDDLLEQLEQERAAAAKALEGKKDDGSRSASTSETQAEDKGQASSQQEPETGTGDAPKEGDKSKKTTEQRQEGAIEETPKIGVAGKEGGTVTVNPLEEGKEEKTADRSLEGEDKKHEEQQIVPAIQIKTADCALDADISTQLEQNALYVSAKQHWANVDLRDKIKQEQGWPWRTFAIDQYDEFKSRTVELDLKKALEETEALEEEIKENRRSEMFFFSEEYYLINSPLLFVGMDCIETYVQHRQTILANIIEEPVVNEDDKKLLIKKLEELSTRLTHRDSPLLRVFTNISLRRWLEDKDIIELLKDIKSFCEQAQLQTKKMLDEEFPFYVYLANRKAEEEEKRASEEENSEERGSEEEEDIEEKWPTYWDFSRSVFDFELKRVLSQSIRIREKIGFELFWAKEKEELEILKQKISDTWANNSEQTLEQWEQKWQDYFCQEGNFEDIYQKVVKSSENDGNAEYLWKLVSFIGRKYGFANTEDCLLQLNGLNVEQTYFLYKLRCARLKAIKQWMPYITKIINFFYSQEEVVEEGKLSKKAKLAGFFFDQVRLNIQPKDLVWELFMGEHSNQDIELLEQRTISKLLTLEDTHKLLKRQFLESFIQTQELYWTEEPLVPQDIQSRQFWYNYQEQNSELLSNGYEEWEHQILEAYYNRGLTGEQVARLIFLMSRIRVIDTDQIVQYIPDTTNIYYEMFLTAHTKRVNRESMSLDISELLCLLSLPLPYTDEEGVTYPSYVYSLLVEQKSIIAHSVWGIEIDFAKQLLSSNKQDGLFYWQTEQIVNGVNYTKPVYLPDEHNFLKNCFDLVTNINGKTKLVIKNITHKLFLTTQDEVVDTSIANGLMPKIMKIATTAYERWVNSGAFQTQAGDIINTVFSFVYYELLRLSTVFFTTTLQDDYFFLPDPLKEYANQEKEQLKIISRDRIEEYIKQVTEHFKNKKEKKQQQGEEPEEYEEYYSEPENVRELLEDWYTQQINNWVYEQLVTSHWPALIQSLAIDEEDNIESLHAYNNVQQRLEWLQSKKNDLISNRVRTLLKDNDELVQGISAVITTNVFSNNIKKTILEAAFKELVLNRLEQNAYFKDELQKIVDSVKEGEHGFINFMWGVKDSMSPQYKMFYNQRPSEVIIELHENLSIERQMLTKEQFEHILADQIPLLTQAVWHDWINHIKVEEELKLLKVDTGPIVAEESSESSEFKSILVSLFDKKFVEKCQKEFNSKFNPEFVTDIKTKLAKYDESKGENKEKQIQTETGSSPVDNDKKQKVLSWLQARNNEKKHAPIYSIPNSYVLEGRELRKNFKNLLGTEKLSEQEQDRLLSYLPFSIIKLSGFSTKDIVKIRNSRNNLFWKEIIQTLSQTNNNQFIDTAINSEWKSFKGIREQAFQKAEEKTKEESKSSKNKAIIALIAFGAVLSAFAIVIFTPLGHKIKTLFKKNKKRSIPR